jgi:hypothetical protein
MEVANHLTLGQVQQLERKERTARAIRRQRLRRIRYLLRRSGCYRLKRLVAGWDLHPLEIAPLHGAE